MNKIFHGDCLEVLKTLPENSIDSIVTDPPYELGFMGKSWDSTGIANNVEMWKECLRVLKPGGHLLSFGGTRTYHRMASAIEDAGFEVRDMIEWVYGSGMSKGNVWNKGKKRTSERLNKENDLMVANGYEGWGNVGMKPSHEPIAFCRKPIEKGLTVAENCLKWGTGGINIDESRVPAGEDHKKNATRHTNKIYPGGFNDSPINSDANPLGRFPANLIHDNSEEVRECFPETKSVKSQTTNERYLSGNDNTKQSGDGKLMYGKISPENTHGDSGNASRFFRSIPQVVDYNDFLIYNRSILTNIKQLCGQHLTKKKTDTILDGVIKEAEKFIQDAELLIFGNSTMEKFLKDTASTIKTLIAQMTELKTLNVLPNWLIMKFTEDYEKTIKQLKELNTEDVKNAESINHLIVFKREMLELIRDIVKNVVIKNSENGKLKTENELIPTQENINGNIKKNIGERKNFKSIIYQAKASKSERNRGCEGLYILKDNTPISKGNIHPTIKNVKLMEYLIKMVTPKGGIVLDPFAGSGSTLIAAKQNGYKYIGIEKETEYITIAEARINSIPNKLF